MKWNMHIETYRGRKRGRQVWRWRVIADNGRVLANSGEAYINKADMNKALSSLFGVAHGVEHIPQHVKVVEHPRTSRPTEKLHTGR